MFDLFPDLGKTLTSPTFFGVCQALVASTACSLLCQFLYELFYERRETGSQIQRSFMLLGPSITLVFITVQLSLPLSLGLLGALSIVRFRVPIKEPEEIGFLMILIASSITCATSAFSLAAALYALVVITLTLRSISSGSHALRQPLPGQLAGQLRPEHGERGRQKARSPDRREECTSASRVLRRS